MKTTFKTETLPVEQLRELGLMNGDEILLPDKHLQAMLAGRRTDFVRLENISSGEDTIPRIDVKLSLSYKSGNIHLNIHPIYKQPKTHPALTDWAKEYLIEGPGNALELEVKTGKGKKQNRVFEYDSDTNEFISYAPANLLPPEQINQSVLTLGQKARFRKGEWILLDDGTSIQHRASDPTGILSSDKELVFSVKENDSLLIHKLIDLRSLMMGIEKGGKQEGLADKRNIANQESQPEGNLLIKERSRGYNQSGSR